MVEWTDSENPNPRIATGHCADLTDLQRRITSFEQGQAIMAQELGRLREDMAVQSDRMDRLNQPGGQGGQPKTPRAWERMRFLFLRPNFPPLFAILVGVLGWQISLLDSTFSGASLLVYDLTCKASDDLPGSRQNCEISLTNASLTKDLKNFKVTLAASEQSDKPVFLGPPYDQITTHGLIETPAFSDTAIRLSILDLPPQDNYKVAFDKTRRIALSIILDQSSDILLKQSSLLTWIIIHRLQIHLTLVIILVLLIVYFFVSLPLSNKESRSAS